MEITRINIAKRASYEPNPGRFVAEIRFQSDKGNMDIPLSIEVSEKLLSLLTPVIVEFSQRATNEVAAILTKQLAENSTPVIEA